MPSLSIEPVQKPPKTHLLINRNFALLWSGRIISQTGDFFLYTTLILWVATSLARNLPWTPLAVSGVTLALTLPTLLVGPLAGVFVDRWDRRRTMLRMDLIRAGLLTLLLLATGLVPLPFAWQNSLPLFWKLGAIYCALILVGACSQFFSTLALIGEIVPERLRTQATGFSSITINFALILGPSLAAPLFFALGARWAIIIDALSFCASFLFILFIRNSRVAANLDQRPQRHFWHEFREGLRFYQGNRVLVVLLVTGILFNSGAGTSDALYILFALVNLHTPQNLAGLFGPAYGLGVISASFLMVFLARRIGEGRVLGFSLVFWGIIISLFARLTTYIPGLVAFFLLGAFNAGINVTVGPLLLKVTPREFVGRVASVLTPAITLASLLSAALAGYLISNPLHNLHAIFLNMSFGPLDTVFTIEGLLVVCAGIHALIALSPAQTGLNEQ